MNSGGGRSLYLDNNTPKSYCLPRARYPSGKGEVCKTFIRRFDSDPRLQILQRISAEYASFLVPLDFSANVRISTQICGEVPRRVPRRAERQPLRPIGARISSHEAGCRMSFCNSFFPILRVKVHLQGHPAVAWQATAGRICSSESLNSATGSGEKALSLRSSR